MNVKFLIEGEEESGGESIETYVAEKPAELACDAVVICDTEMFAAGLPTLTTGLRGLVYGEIAVEGARQDLHSGSYGGAAPNVLMAIAEILTALKHRDGRVLIPRFYERVKAPAEAELAAWRSLPFNEEEYRKKEVGSAALTGEPGYSVLERVWARPTFEVHGIRGGFVGEGAKTVIPARATVKISTRLVPDQQPDEIVALTQRGHRGGVPARRQSRIQTAERGAGVGGGRCEPVHQQGLRGAGRSVRAQDRIHALRRFDSDCRLVPRAPGRAECADGLRPAGRQPAFAQREVPSAELLSRHRGRDEVPGAAGAVKHAHRGVFERTPKVRTR